MTHYQLTGNGQLILLLHGWGDSLEGLQGLATELSKKYQVLSVDLPGFGGTQAPEAIWDLDNYVDFLTSLLHKLELKQPYAVVGHSNGGALAIRAVASKKLRARKLVLIAASGVRTGNTLRRGVLMIVAKVGNLATIWMPERYRQALRKSLYGVAGSDMLVAPHLQETFKKTVRQDVQGDAARVAVPTLLIYAADDKAVPLTHGHRFNQLIKQSRLETFDRGGHFIHLAEPAKVNKLVGDFLNAK